MLLYSLPSENVVIEPFLIAYDYDERSNRDLSYKKTAHLR